MKTLTLKRVVVWLMNNQLKNTPPKEFTNTEEMEKLINRILPTFKDYITDWAEREKEVKAIQREFAQKKLTEEDANKKLRELQNKMTDIELTKGEEEVSVEFEDDDFNSLFQMFERWGKNWFGTIENFIDVRDAMNETNRQSKDKDKKEKKEDK